MTSKRSFRQVHRLRPPTRQNWFDFDAMRSYRVAPRVFKVHPAGCLHSPWLSRAAAFTHTVLCHNHSFPSAGSLPLRTRQRYHRDRLCVRDALEMSMSAAVV